MTINEGLALVKTLKARHAELQSLRQSNLNRTRYRIQGQPDQVEEPTYDVKAIDTKIVGVAKELRLLDAAIKSVNAKTKIDFTHDEGVLEAIS